jgi:purine-binding chemotaxis protein CheW
MSDVSQNLAQTTGHAAAAGKYLTFRLDGEDYGIEILKVREIIGRMDITRVPQTREFVRGVINLRGKVIPVLDLRAKFGLPPAAETAQTCIIVVDVGTLMGLLVDAVQEVHDIPADKLEPPPRLGQGVGADLLLGLGKVKNEIKLLLDVERVLTGEDLVAAA